VAVAASSLCLFALRLGAWGILAVH
jgi:hypothetical protein